ncbi:hypothetical protein [Rhodoglobus aureus]|uniref:hypothetical protein n=1 Tax=Rhodoglobus aureus TaxID=191497 RepID=UPI0031CF09BD
MTAEHFEEYANLTADQRSPDRARRVFRRARSASVADNQTWGNPRSLADDG